MEALFNKIKKKLNFGILGVWEHIRFLKLDLFAGGYCECGMISMELG